MRTNLIRYLLIAFSAYGYAATGNCHATEIADRGRDSDSLRDFLKEVKKRDIRASEIALSPPPPVEENEVIDGSDINDYPLQEEL